MIHSINLKNFKFSRKLIKIKEEDEIEIIIGKNEYNYKKLNNYNNYFIFQIMNENEDEEELDTSSKLYEKQKYNFKFNKDGDYYITVLNIPNLYLKVQVCIKDKKKLINTKNLNSLKTNENTQIDYNISETFKSNKIKEFTFSSSITNNENEIYFEDKIITKEDFKNELNLLNDKEISNNNFSKKIEINKINQKINNSIHKNFNNIRSFEFNSNNNLLDNFDDFILKYSNQIDLNKLNINIDKKFLFNEIDQYYLNWILN